MDKISQFIATCWYGITQIGITPSDSYSESRRVALTNEVALFGFVIPQFYNAFYIYYDFKLLIYPIIVNLIGSTICLSVFTFNKHHKRRAARYLITFCPNVQIFLLTYYLSTATGMHLLHIMMVSFVMFLYSDEPRYKITIVTMFPIVLYVVAFLKFTPFDSPIILDAQILQWFYISISVTVFLLVMLFFALFYLKIDHTEKLLEMAHERSEKLLLNILPEEVAERLKENPGTIAKEYPSVTVLFANIVGFTKITTSVRAIELVDTLNKVFSEFDALAEKYDLEKIKTIGDSYMVAGGIPTPIENHVELMALLALDMLKSVNKFHLGDTPLEVRIGFHDGPVVAGVIGEKKFSYDIWGDTVNIASRLESHGVKGKIQVSEEVFQQLQSEFNFEHRGITNIKGIGPKDTYFLVSKK